MEYRRAKIEGGIFFTVVTHNRRNFLCEPENILLRREGFRKVIREYPFIVDAVAVLTNHIHCIWKLPPGDSDFSKRWRLIKSYFSHRCDTRSVKPPAYRKYQGRISASRQHKADVSR